MCTLPNVVHNNMCALPNVVHNNMCALPNVVHNNMCALPNVVHNNKCTLLNALHNNMCTYREHWVRPHGEPIPALVFKEPAGSASYFPVKLFVVDNKCVDVN